MKNNIILYAPNVHKGGGATLLKELLSEINKVSASIAIAFLDQRFKSQIDTKFSFQIVWVKPKLISRFMAEVILFIKTLHNPNLFCFGGIPPIFALSKNIIVFQQNRNLLCLNSLNEFNFKTAIRLRIERVICKLMHPKVRTYVVQTDSMSREVCNWQPGAEVKILPFRPHFPIEEHPSKEILWDYIYVSDGTGHKNHLNLLKAWEILSKEGIRPSLALTLGDENFSLVSQIANTSKKLNLRIKNLGLIPHENIIMSYKDSKALIFPSTSESFGLPLLEAKDLKLDIIASELDFVRDVCDPIQTFDPYSPVSIARAVKRHMGICEDKTLVSDAKIFWQKLLWLYKENSIS